MVTIFYPQKEAFSQAAFGYREALIADEQNSRRNLKVDAQKEDCGLLDVNFLTLRRWTLNKEGLCLHLLMNVHFFMSSPVLYTPISVLLIAALGFEAR